MRIGHLFAASVLTCVASSACAAGASCQPPIALDVSGPRPTVQMSLANGKQGVAVFDTGAMGAVVDSRYAEELGLANEGPVDPPFDRLPGAGNYKSTLTGLRLGGIAVGDISVPVVPTPVPGIAAVLSPKIFSGRLVELTLGSGQLRVCDRDTGLRDLGPGTPYSGQPFALPVIPVTIGGVELAAHIDTGSPMALAFPMRFAEQFALASPLTRAGSARGHIGESPVYKARIKGAVRVGPMTLQDPEVTFTDVLPMPNVGTKLLRQMVITVDPEGQQSWTRLASQNLPPLSAADPPRHP